MADYECDTSRDPEAVADAEARAEIAAGKFVPQAAVMAWVRSWGKPDELPCPLPDNA